MILRCLASGSSGNCYILENDTEALVLEAGVSFKEVKIALNFNVQKIVGVLVSHKHKDHSAYTREYLNACIPVYTNPETANAIETNYRVLLHAKEEKQRFQCGNFTITPFDLPHDDTRNFGYLIEHQDIGRLLFLTDFEYCKYRFKDINHVMVETNYSMLGLDISNMPNYEHITRGHCELQTAKRFVEATQSNSDALVSVILLHLGHQNANVDNFTNEISKSLKNENRALVAKKNLVINLSERMRTTT